MSNRVFYWCPDCGTLFIGEYGVRPVCPRCVWGHQEEVENLEQEKHPKKGSPQYYSEWMVICNGVLYSCPNCKTLFFDECGKIVCPRCGYY